MTLHSAVTKPLVLALQNTEQETPVGGTTTASPNNVTAGNVTQTTTVASTPTPQPTELTPQQSVVGLAASTTTALHAAIGTSADPDEGFSNAIHGRKTTDKVKETAIEVSSNFRLTNTLVYITIYNIEGINYVNICFILF